MTQAALGRRGLPTSYAGQVFRSRLEARFAVLFEHLRLRWEYEPEGFELPSGLYVPDFWMPDLGVWIEVKPDRHAAVESPAYEIAADLATLTGKPVCIATGLDDWAIGDTVYLRRYPGDARPDYAYLTECDGRFRFQADCWAGDIGPFLLRSRRVAVATEVARRATFERPAIAPYPLVVR